MNINIFDEDDLFDTHDPDKDFNDLSSDDENHVTTPSTRTLSREKSPEENEKSHSSSFRDPTIPLEAATFESGTFESGMTNSAILRHVSCFRGFYAQNLEKYFNLSARFASCVRCRYRPLEVLILKAALLKVE